MDSGGTPSFVLRGKTIGMKIWTSEDIAKWAHYKQILKQFCFMFFILATLLTYAQNPFGGMSKSEFKRYVKRAMANGESVEWSSEGGFRTVPNVDAAEQRMHSAEARLNRARREVSAAQDSAELDSAQRDFKRAKRDFADAENQYYQAKAQQDREEADREFWGGDVVGGDNDVFVRDGRLVQVQPPRPDWPVNTDIYPDGAVKSSCMITPNLRIKKQPRPCIAGQISVTLSGGLSGEPIVCLYILTKENKPTRSLGDYGDGRNGYELRSVIMRPALGTPMRQNVYDGWEKVYVSSRVKYGYGYQGEGSSIEEKSMRHQIPALKRLTMNETRPDNPFVTFYDIVGAALYHIEVWHSGKCIGIKDGQVGSGIITPPCKDWFVRERWGDGE